MQQKLLSHIIQNYEDKIKHIVTDKLPHQYVCIQVGINFVRDTR